VVGDKKIGNAALHSSNCAFMCYGAATEEKLFSQAPVNNFQAATGFIGIKPTTNRQHMVRAILESIVFRVVQLFQCLQREVKNHYISIRLVTMKNKYPCKLQSKERSTYHMNRYCFSLMFLLIFINFSTFNILCLDYACLYLILLILGGWFSIACNSCMRW